MNELFVDSIRSSELDPYNSSPTLATQTW